MNTLDGVTQSERLFVIVSGSGGLKILGAPCLQQARGSVVGDAISKVTVELSNKWNCAQNTIGTLFDTTATNTVCKRAACIAIQRCLHHLLLWFARRHHVGEVVLHHV